MIQLNKGWRWIPSLYFAQGIPYVAVMVLAVIMYKRLGISNTEIAFYTGWLNLPWVIKPLWSPLVDLLKTKRWWIVTMQLVIGGGLAGIGLCLPLPFYFQLTLAFFWLVAFSSATHDIAADGFYMLALNEHDQSFFVGIRSTFYRIAMISGQGGLVIVAGLLERHFSPNEQAPDMAGLSMAWAITFIGMAILFLLFSLYHKFFLPHPTNDTPKGKTKSAKNILRDFFATFGSFFQKKEIVSGLFFLLTYRLAESQLVKLASPFLLDTPQEGGLGLSTTTVGVVYGTLGVLALTIGGIIGGIVVARYGLKRMLWPMSLAITLPNVVYIYLAYTHPTSMYIIGSAVIVEQLGYGFGFTAYMLYMIHLAQGEQSTAHYALCTAFMALGMMVPGMVAGWLQSIMGYSLFFVWVMICTLPCFIAVAWVRRTLK